MKSRILLSGARRSSASSAAKRILLRKCCRALRSRQSVFDADRRESRELDIGLVLDYFRYLVGEDICLPMVLCLMSRVADSGAITITQRNLYPLVVVACLLAHKMQQDEEFENAFFATRFKIPLRELNAMEREFLKLCDYRLHTSASEYCRYLRLLALETLECS